MLIMCVSKRHLYLSLGSGIDRFPKQNVLEYCISASADPSGRAFKGVDLRPLACLDYGFEFRLWCGDLSLENIEFL